jgi:Protein of unknown function (DUF3060)
MMKILLAGLLVSSVALADVNEMDNNKTHTVDCSKDATVRVNGNKNSFQLKGTCTSVQISGNLNIVTGDAAKSVMISGNENAVTLTIDNAMISGNKNSVTYKGKKPKTADNGTGNVITPAK